MKLKQILVALLIISMIVSCNFPEQYFSPKPECLEQENSFKSINPLSQAYQSEVRAVLENKSPEDFRYFFVRFVEEQNKDYMLTNFRNKKSCFDVKMLVDKWDKLGGMKRTDGKSYPEELYDLKWKLTNIDGKQEVVYSDMHKIID